MTLLARFFDHLPDLARHLTQAFAHPLVQTGLQALAGWAVGPGAAGPARTCPGGVPVDATPSERPSRTARANLAARRSGTGTAGPPTMTAGFCTSRSRAIHPSRSPPASTPPTPSSAHLWPSGAA